MGAAQVCAGRGHEGTSNLAFSKLTRDWYSAWVNVKRLSGEVSSWPMHVPVPEGAWPWCQRWAQEMFPDERKRICDSKPDDAAKRQALEARLAELQSRIAKDKQEVKSTKAGSGI